MLQERLASSFYLNIYLSHLSPEAAELHFFLNGLNFHS